MKTLALSSASLLALAVPTLGDLVTPVSQVRIVSGFAAASDLSEMVTDNDSDTAPDFGPFVEGAAATASVPDALGSGGGTQDSSIQATTLTVSGSHFANGEAYNFDSFGEGSGSSSFSYTFDLNAPSDYTLDGFVEGFDNGLTEVSLKLDNLELFGAIAFDGQVLVEESGSLVPGRYTLYVISSGNAFGGDFAFDYSSGAYDLIFDLDGVAPPPVIGSLTGKTSGPLSGGNSVTVKGGCFTPSTQVRFGGIPASSVTYVDANTLQAEVPPYPLSVISCPSLLLLVDVTVSDAAGSSTLALGYVYTMRPRSPLFCAWGANARLAP